jgi:hypothetical protein
LITQIGYEQVRSEWSYLCALKIFW